MNTRDIEAFIAVVDAGSIMGAAARLHLTQPAVTRRIQALEEALGAQLLDRQSKPLRPTAAGRDAYELGRRVLGSVHDLRSGLAADGDVIGELRLGITPSNADDALSEPFDRLRKSYPQLGLRVTSGWAQELLAQVESNRIDAAFVYLPGNDSVAPSLDAEEIARFATFIVAPKGLGLRKRPALADLADRLWVLNQDGCGFRRVIRQELARAGLPFVVAVETYSAELRLALVARGLGIGIATEATMQRSKYRNSVDVLDVRDFKADVRAWLVHRPLTGRLAAPLASFSESLKAALPKSERGGRAA